MKTSLERVSELKTRSTGSSTEGSGLYHLGIEVDAEVDIVAAKRRDAGSDGRRKRGVGSRVASRLEAIKLAVL